MSLVSTICRRKKVFVGILAFQHPEGMFEYHLMLKKKKLGMSILKYSVIKLSHFLMILWDSVQVSVILVKQKESD